MGVYNNNKDGTRSTIANTIQVVDAPMEQFVSRGEFSAVTPSDVSADNKLVAENEVTKAVSTMPTASSSLVGTIVQYVGTTTANYTNGYFYKCVSDGAVTPTYSWEEVISGGGGGSSLVNVIDSPTAGNVGGVVENATREIENYVSPYGTVTIVPNVASGDFSHAEGMSVKSGANIVTTTASGLASHAEGGQTTASGICSHAEGEMTVASNETSHAEGFQTTASGQGSHAEGGMVTASGNLSHAEGGGTTASGNSSHAEGHMATASGDCSHAEGGTFDFSNDNPRAFGLYEYDENNETYIKTTDSSFAEDKTYYFPPMELTKEYIIAFPPDTNPSDKDWLEQQSEGIYVNTQDTTVDKSKIYYLVGMAIETFDSTMQHNANGWFSHVEGFNNIAVDFSHAEGWNTQAIGSPSHAEGSGTLAIGDYSHAEGYATQAIDESAHAEGENTTASGYASHAEGDSTIASGQVSHAEGQGIIASGNASHSEGSFTTASGDCSHAEGHYTTASGDCSHAEGLCVTSSGWVSHAEGGAVDFRHSPSEYELYEYKENNETYIKTTDSSFVLAKDYYFPPIEITKEYISRVIVNPLGFNPSEEGWFEQQSEGVYIHTQDTTLQKGKTYYLGLLIVPSHMDSPYTDSQHIANGYFSHVEGYHNIAYNYGSHAEGIGTLASGQGSHTEGVVTMASGAVSHAEGNGTRAIGESSHAEGNVTKASGFSSHAQNDGTVAQGYGQTAIGKYNVAQGQGTADSTLQTDYALIIGNGTVNTRSNALAIQWDGTIVFANGETLTPAQITQLKALLS